MKGVILAGGTGSRLWPLTSVTNKHLLPVYDKPMIFYPLEQMASCHIRNVMLVCGGNSFDSFRQLLGDGSNFGLNLSYAYQTEPDGIAGAMSLAERFVGGEQVCVTLADNIFEKSMRPNICMLENKPGAAIFCTRVANPQHYGVVEVDDRHRIERITEKPPVPSSDLIATGFYVYDDMVWDILRGLDRSARREFEITDVNNKYIAGAAMTYVKFDGWWVDCGESIDGYLDACVKVRGARKCA